MDFSVPVFVSRFSSPMEFSSSRVLHTFQIRTFLCARCLVLSRAHDFPSQFFPPENKLAVQRLFQRASAQIRFWISSLPCSSRLSHAAVPVDLISLVGLPPSINFSLSFQLPLKLFPFPAQESVMRQNSC
jgi:hypothetical protein